MMLDEIGAFLEDHALGTQGTTIFLGDLPDTPDDCIALFEYAGEAPLRTHNSRRTALERPRLQVVVRDTAYDEARITAQNIYNALDGIRNEALSGTRYLFVKPIQSPFLMGRDENRRVKIGFNCEVEKEVSGV